MAGPVVEVQPQFPEGQPCQGVQFYAAAALAEDRAGQIQIAPQDGRIMFLHLFRHSTQDSCTCNIRGPLQVLGARIHQQEAVMDQGDIGFLIGIIMHDGAMAAGRDDRREALVQEAVLLPAQLQQTGRHVQFRDPALFVIHSVQDLVQPVQELCDRHAVPDMGPADVGRLHGILDRLFPDGPVPLTDNADTGRHSRQQGHVAGASVQQQGRVFRQFPQVFVNSEIRTDLHTVLRQLLPDVRRDRFL